MEPVEGTRTFHVAKEAYESFMGRYSRPLARSFATYAGVAPGNRVLDVGCGTGALTSELVAVVGEANVGACDPTPPFLAACAADHPGIDARHGAAEQLPFDDGSYDAVLAQLILHFVSDVDAAMHEMRRVARHGATVAACQWASSGGMELIHRFWDAAVVHDPDAPAETNLRFGEPGELADLFRRVGLVDVDERALDLRVSYATFDELWTSYLAAVGPAGVYCASLDDAHREAVRRTLFDLLGSPTGSFELTARARMARATNAAAPRRA